MKKITTITSASLIMLALFSSCKKDNTVALEPAQRKLVKVDLTGSATNTWYYSYNAQGRLSELKTNSYTNQYDFTSSLFSSATVSNSTTKKTYEIITASSAGGKVTGIYSKSFKADGSLNYSEAQSFQYNAEGHTTNYSYGTYSYAYEYTGGNITKYTATNASAPYGDATYEYYTDKTSKLNLNWFESQFQQQYLNDMELFGKKNKNLLKKSTSAYIGGNTYAYDFAYTFDAEGYIATCTATETTNGVKSAVYNYTFTYQ